MRVEYDQAMSCFKIYPSDFDNHCVVMSHQGEVKSYEVVSDDEFVVAAKFGEVMRFDADGR